MSRPSSLFSHAVLGLAATTLLTTGCYKVGYKTGLPAGGGTHEVTVVVVECAGSGATASNP